MIYERSFLLNQLESNYQEFLELCIQGLKNRLGEGYNVSLNSILKNNSITMDGVVILKDGAKMTPNIYLGEYFESYQNGCAMEEILSSLLEVYNNHMEQRKEIEITYTYEAMKESIIFRIVNLEKNEELLKNCPYIKFLDLAVTFHCLIQEEIESIGTIRITNEHLNLWDVKKEDLLSCAMKNTPKLFPPLIRRMEDVLRELLEENTGAMHQEEIEVELRRMEEDSDEDSNRQNTLYILSNTKGINGASCILYPEVIRNFARLLKNNIYVLPSSIHEVILLPADSVYGKEQLEAMVCEINQSEVPYEEVLSNHIYYYSIEKKQLMIL